MKKNEDVKKLKQVGVRLTKEHHKQFSDLAHDQRDSKAAIMHRLILEYIKKHKK